jgi:hypothetical protein
VVRDHLITRAFDDATSDSRAIDSMGKVHSTECIRGSDGGVDPVGQTFVQSRKKSVYRVYTPHSKTLTCLPNFFGIFCLEES